jgi:hypothetical protein
VKSITDTWLQDFKAKSIKRGRIPDPGGLKDRDNAAFGVEPQGKGLANQVSYRPAIADLADFACKRL